MARPHKKRCISKALKGHTFKPAGVPGRELEQVFLKADELEALRLVDLEGLYHEQAASLMKVSRATLGRIVSSARRKLADVVINGRALVVQDSN